MGLFGLGFLGLISLAMIPTEGNSMMLHDGKFCPNEGCLELSLYEEAYSLVNELFMKNGYYEIYERGTQDYHKDYGISGENKYEYYEMDEDVFEKERYMEKFDEKERITIANAMSKWWHPSSRGCSAQ